MPTLDLDSHAGKYLIRAYQPGRISINEQQYTQSLIVTPSQLIIPWPPQTVDELTSSHLKIQFDRKPDILIIGTGDTQALLPVQLYGELLNQGIGVEIMPTRSACYTFNALSSENRQVAAALLIR